MRTFAAAKRLAHATLPMGFRQRLAVWLGGRRWLARRHWWATELVSDLVERDPDAYHRFLWGHHLGYAKTYETAHRFGADKVHPTRRLLFGDLCAHLASRDLDPARDVRSVFEVGCSMGYLLRFMETEVFPGAATLEGIDIDRYAIRTGATWLAEQGSRVQVAVADMTELDQLLDGRRFDVVLCAGVLMYLRQEPAAAVVAAMLAHANHVVALAGLAHPEQDNCSLDTSAIRQSDGTFIHNLDAMVHRAGGRVLSRRWEGPRMVEGNTVYFVLAAPSVAV